MTGKNVVATAIYAVRKMNNKEISYGQILEHGKV